MRRWIAAVVVLVGVALARPVMAQIDNQCGPNDGCDGGGAPVYDPSPGEIIGGTGLLAAPTSTLIDSDDVWGYAPDPGNGTWPTTIYLNTGGVIQVQDAGPVIPGQPPINWNGIFGATCAINGAVRIVGGSGANGVGTQGYAYVCSAIAMAKLMNAIQQAIANSIYGWWITHGGGTPFGWYFYWYYHPIYSASGWDG